MRPGHTTDWIALACSIAFHAAILGVLSLGAITRPIHRATEARSVSLPIQVSILRPSEAPIEPLPPVAPLEPTDVRDSPPVPLPEPRPRVATPGYVQAGVASVARGPAVDIGVGLVRDRADFPSDIRAQLAAEFPLVPARLPRTQRPVTIAYPEAALREGREDRVFALVLLDTNGTATEIIVIPDDPIFGRAIREALAATSFVPAYDNGKAIRYWLGLKFEFNMASGDAPRTAPR